MPASYPIYGPQREQREPPRHLEVKESDVGIAGNMSGILQGAPEPPPEVPEGEGEVQAASGYNPYDATIPEVQDYVTANPAEAQAVYDAEKSGKARVTLVAWLEEHLD